MRMKTNSSRKLGTLLSLVAGAAVSLTCAGRAWADPVTIKVDQPGAKVSSMLYGLMTEEINYSYDGGLYGELIQNRIFKNPPAGGAARGAPGPATAAAAPGPVAGGPTPIPHWTTVTKGAAKAAIATDTSNPVNTTALTTALKLDITAGAPGERAGVANDGFWGIPVKPATQYTASFYAKSAGFAGPLTVDIESSDGSTVYASGTVEGVGTAWKKYTLTLTTAANVKPTAATRFVISGASTGTVWFNLVSLFPPTYKDRPNGNRIDIMQLLADIHPAFLRFPGGNYVEGSNFASRYNWKETIGPLEDRPGHPSPWNYRSSDGMGLLEFCEWCEDLNMEPVLAVWACYTLDSKATPAADYPKYAQEAVEEIEYVMGDASTEWGARRAKDGHPAPFKFRYVEIGNEDGLRGAAGGGPTYDARFTVFSNAIKARFPQVQTIASSPNIARTTPPDVQDEHHYPRTVAAALALTGGYDTARRTGPKIFVGEWATRIGSPTPQFSACVADAAYMTALERNSDLVIMYGYAPLFVNVNPGGMQWQTDLIGYDALASFGSPSYYVQALFAKNRGDTILPRELAARDIYVSATRDDQTKEVILKMVNTRTAEAPMDITLQGVTRVDPGATGWTLTGNPADVNSVANPTLVSPKEFKINNAASKFTYTLPPQSVVVLRVKAN
jgi:alpha-N-arabinofuranosidase